MKNEIAKQLYLVIPLTDDDAALSEMIGDCMRYESAIARMVKGEISPEDLLDVADSMTELIPSMDQYILEVQENFDELEKQLILL